MKVKIFARGEEQEPLRERLRVIEQYDSFLLAEVAEKDFDRLSKDFLVEDISDSYLIPLGEEKIDTTAPRIAKGGKTRPHPQYRKEKALSPGPHHYLIQFIGPIKEEWLQAVKKAGGELRAPYGHFTYVVRADEKGLKKIMDLPWINWAGHLPPQARIAPSALKYAGRKAGDIYSDLPRTRVMPGKYVVRFFGSDDLAGAEGPVRQAGIEILDRDAGARAMVVKITGSRSDVREKLAALAAIHGVQSIEERVLKRVSNDVAAGIMGTKRSCDKGFLGLTGEGEILGVCDSGLDTGDKKNIHEDFAKRVTFIKSYPITPDFNDDIDNPGADDGPEDCDSGHGTHVAGSVVGNGAAAARCGIDPPIRGLASRAKLVFQAIEQRMEWKDPADYYKYGRYYLAGIPLDLTVLFKDAYGKKVRIHSNSWGGGDPGDYDTQCEQLDRFVWDHRDFCIVFAAGNDGTDSDGDGKINLQSVTPPATAKNCITIGACESERPDFNHVTYGAWWPKDYPVAPFRKDPMADNPEQVVAFSSRGPTADNRIKPEVIAPGTFILSTRSSRIATNNKAWAAFPECSAYFFMGGTSMAAPLTAGAVALIREYLRKIKKIKNPSAALLKAALIASAMRLPTGEGDLADNHQGFGRVNLDTVLSPEKPGRTEYLDVKPGLKTGESRIVTVNLLSDEVPFRTVLAYTDYPGKTLINNLNLVIKSPDGKLFPGNESKGAEAVLDATNNVEVVHISKPKAGPWEIQVIGSNVVHGPQDFALVYLGHMK